MARWGGTRVDLGAQLIRLSKGIREPDDWFVYSRLKGLLGDSGTGRRLRSSLASLLCPVASGRVR